MAQFTVTGDIDPFLHISLLRNETIYCESNAMVMMESTLELKGKMTGGLGSALIHYRVQYRSWKLAKPAIKSLMARLSLPKVV